MKLQKRLKRERFGVLFKICCFQFCESCYICSTMKKCLHVVVPLTVRSFFGSARTGTEGRDLQRCLPGTLWRWVEMGASYIQTFKFAHTMSGFEFLTTALATSIRCGFEIGRRPRLVKKRIPNQRYQPGTRRPFFWTAVHVGPLPSEKCLIYFMYYSIVF